MADVSVEGLDRLIAKAKELKQLLQETPEILEFIRLADKFSDGRAVLPMPTDRLVCSGEAAEILKVSQGKICDFIRAGVLTPLKSDESSKRKFWLSEVKAVPKKTA